MHLRSDNGIPNYDNAFRYFSIAADDEIVGGYLGKADLAAGGYGGYVSNNALACSLVRKAYDITIRDVLWGNYDNLFPEAAAKFGDLIQNEPERLEDAMRYYLQAKGVLLKRNLIQCTEDDMLLLNEIDSRITDFGNRLNAQGQANLSFSPEDALAPMGENNGANTLEVEKASEGGYILTFRRAEQQPLRAVQGQEFFMAADVESRACYFLKKLVLRADRSDECNEEYLNKVITFDDSYYDRTDNTYVMFFYGTVVAKIKGVFRLELDQCDFYEVN